MSRGTVVPGGTPGRKVLLIGGTGYVGDEMRFRLRDAGHSVTLLVRDIDTEQHEGFVTVQGDVTDPVSLVGAMHHVGPDAIINLVAIIRETGDASFERINYQGTINVVDAAHQTGVRRLIQMSALGTDNLPDYPYYYSKWRAENYVKNSGLDWTIFRPSIIFGPGKHPQFVTQLADAVRMAPVIPVVGDGRARFQPVHLTDVSDAFERSLRDPETIRHTIELAGPEVLTYEEILDECAQALGTRKPKLRVPVAVMKPAAALMETIPFIEAPVTVEQLKMLEIDNVTEHNGIGRLLGRDLISMRGNIDYVTG